MSNETFAEVNSSTMDKNTTEEIKPANVKKVSDVESDSTTSAVSKTNGTLNNNLPASDIESKDDNANNVEKSVNEPTPITTMKAAEPQASLEQINSSASEIINRPSDNADIESAKEPEMKPAENPSEAVSESDEGKKLEETEKASEKPVLPKWMVEDANAPLSESEIAAEKEKEEAATAKAEAAKKTGGRGRGRGRPAVKATTDEKEQAQVGAGSSSQAVEHDLSPPAGLQRPRRSTRAKIDYANPDSGTVIAEVDDEEPGGLGILRKGGRGGARGGKATGRGRKRKVTETSEDAEIDDDAGSDYGAKPKKKKTPVAKVAPKAGGRGRGRPPATSPSKSKRGRRGRPAGGTRTAKAKAQESEDDDAEVVYDDHESDKEQSPEVEEDDREREIPAAVTTAAKSPLKKRGRPSASAHPPSKPIEKKPAVEEPTTEAEKESKPEEESKETKTTEPEAAAEKPTDDMAMEA